MLNNFVNYKNNFAGKREEDKIEKKSKEKIYNQQIGQYPVKISVRQGHMVITCYTIS